MTRTFVDAGVLIAAATGRDPIVRPAAITILDDPDRTFLSSAFVRLEVLPKAIYNRNLDEAASYEAFFDVVAAWAEALDRVVTVATTYAERHGLAALDALHVAAAVVLGADESYGFRLKASGMVGCAPAVPPGGPPCPAA